MSLHVIGSLIWPNRPRKLQYIFCFADKELLGKMRLIEHASTRLEDRWKD